MKEIIFLDVDGTIVDYANHILASAVKAICQAREKDHLVYVCTGRSRAEMPEKIWKIGFDGIGWWEWFLCRARRSDYHASVNSVGCGKTSSGLVA